MSEAFIRKWMVRPHRPAECGGMALLIIAAATLWGATRPPVGHKQILFTETMPDLEIV